MDNFINAFGDMTVGEVVIFIAGVCFALAIVLKIKDFIIKLHDKKVEERRQIEILIEDVSEIKADLKTYPNKFNEMERQIQEIMKESNNYRIASLRDKIFKDYQEYTTAGKVTDLQLKNFENNVSEYEKRGGNNVVLQKYAPEVRALPVVKR